MDQGSITIPEGFEPEISQSIQIPEGFEPEAPTMASRAEDMTNLGLSYMNGLTAGFGPKVMSGIGAPMAKGVLETTEAINNAFGGDYQAPSMGDLYKTGVNAVQGRVQQSREANPFLSPAAEIAGGVTTGVGVGRTALGKGISNWANGSRVPAGSLLQRATNLLQRSAKGALVGEAGYRTYKVGNAAAGQEAEELLSGKPVGAAIGGALPVLGAGLGVGVAKLAPSVDEGLRETAKLARKYNIPLSMDEITDSRAVKNFQKISQDLPFSGQDNFRDLQQKAFNRAVAKSFGQEADRITPEVMDNAFTSLGKQFDDLTSGQTFKASGEVYEAALKELRDDAQAYSAQAQEALEKQLTVLGKNIDAGQITGKKLGFLRNRINKLATKAKDPEIASAYKDVENLIIDIATEDDLVKKAGFNETKRQYKNLLAIEPIARAGKAMGGNINPSLLSTQVAKIYGRNLTRGKAGELGDLARIGSDLLPEQGGSDTFAKMTYLGGAGLAAHSNPAAVAGIVGGNRAAQSFINRNQKLIDEILSEGQKRLPPTQKSGLAIGSTANAIENP